MTGAATHPAMAAQGLAVLPMPEPDAEFGVVYADLAEHMTQPEAPLALAADLVSAGYAAGVLTDADLMGVTQSRAGIARTCALSGRVLDTLLDEAKAKAEQLVAASGLKLPDMRDLCLSVGAGEAGDNTGLTVEFGMNIRLADMTGFFSDDLPLRLRRVAINAVYAMTLLGPLASLMPVLLDECEMTRMNWVYSLAGNWSEFFEGYVYGDFHDSAEQAWAEFVDFHEAEFSDDDYADFRACWEELTAPCAARFDELGNVALCQPKALRAMSRAARTLGHDHAAFDYARAIAKLTPRLSELEAGYGEAVELNPMDSHKMLTVSTSHREFDLAAGSADTYMQDGESPSLTICDLANTPWSAIRDVLTHCYAQAIAFECLDIYGLLDHYQGQPPQTAGAA